MKHPLPIFLLAVVVAGGCVTSRWVDERQQDMTTLADKIGVVESSLVINFMTGPAQSDKMNGVCSDWIRGYLRESFHVPVVGRLVPDARVVTITSQSMGSSLYDGIELAYSQGGISFVVRQTFGVSVIILEDQDTLGKTNQQLEDLLEQQANLVINSSRSFDVSCSKDVEGYKIFTQNILSGQETDDWLDDIVILVKDDKIYLVTSKRQPPGQSNNFIDTSPMTNDKWFAIANRNSKLRQR